MPDQTVNPPEVFQNSCTVLLTPPRAAGVDVAEEGEEEILFFFFLKLLKKKMMAFTLSLIQGKTHWLLST